MYVVALYGNIVVLFTIVSSCVILQGAPVTDLFVECHLKLHIDITLYYILLNKSDA